MSNPFRDDDAETEAVGTAPSVRRTLSLVFGARSQLIAAPLTVGAADASDFVIQSVGVSRLHARLEPADEGIWVTDLDSTNGTFVDGVRVRRALAVAGSSIRFGTMDARIEARGDVHEVALWPEEQFGPLIGRSPVMRALFFALQQLAGSDATVLVHGETGTGKELVARAIHDASPRRSGPFVVFDCGAVPETLFESELFGHVRGAFTGADRPRDGAVLAASSGTLFLDEVGELPLSMQPKLLRVLESRTVRRVGESKHQPVDVRIVAATHRDLAQLVSRGAFREDLYFRLAVLPVHVPPLRARREDIPLLLHRFLDGHPAPSPSEQREIAARPFLGNVRELRTVAERLRVLGTSAALGIPMASGGPGSSGDHPAIDLDVPLAAQRDTWVDHLEREYLKGWIAREGYHVSTIADRTGLNRTYLHRLLRKHDLAR